jgi:hypothetical protein
MLYLEAFFFSGTTQVAAYQQKGDNYFQSRELKMVSTAMEG